MLSLVVFLPLAGALALAVLPGTRDSTLRRAGVVLSGVDFALVVGLWAAYRPSPGFAYQENLRWIPSIGVGYHVGLDGLSLPLVALTAGLFWACSIYSLSQDRRPRSWVVLMLALETVSLGLFSALDLILFFVYFDLSIVAMYFVIAGWGHGPEAARSALKFFLYTFLGSLALLLGFIGLYLSASPHTFDMVAIVAERPLAGHAVVGALVLGALVVGFAIKTPVVPFHTWLPPAHTDAPPAGSAILAGVLLKMGTYGFVRVAMPMLPDSWRRYALGITILGVVSVVYGALVALGQRSFKRMVAYTSVNHMGYILLALGAAGLLAHSAADARALAVTGAVTQMVSHGLVTGALFLLSGALYERGGTYDLDAFGGLAGPAPRLAGLTAVAAFASLGLPGLSGFIAEFQIFAGSLGPAPVPTAVAFLGILVTAALFLRALQAVFLGPLPPRLATTSELSAPEMWSVVPLLAASLAIGIFPRFLLEVITPASQAVVSILSG